MTSWTLDKHSTNAHDAFFYIECICNAWFTIEILVRLVTKPREKKKCSFSKTFDVECEGIKFSQKPNFECIYLLTLW